MIQRTLNLTFHRARLWLLKWVVVICVLLAAQNSFAQWTSPSSGTTQDLNDGVFVSASVANAVGNNGVVVNSSDRGLTWAIVASGVSLTSETLNDVAFLDANTIVGVGSNGVILRTADGGDVWASITSATGQGLNAIHFSGSNVVAVGVANGGASTIVYSSDSGATWAAATIASDPGNNLNDVVFLSATVALAIGNGGTILRTTDSGVNWSPITGSAVTDNLNDVVFVDANTIVGVGASGAILRSEDAGATWSAPLSPTTNSLTAVSFSGTNIFAVGQSGGGTSTVIYSTDSGATWSGGTVASDPNQNVADVVALSTTTAIAVGVNNGGVSTILRTTDSGANWSVQAVTGDPGQDLSEVAFNGTNVIAVGNANGGTSTILLSTNSGVNWNLQTVAVDPGDHLSSVYFVTASTVTAVGANGTILLSANTGATWVDVLSPTGNQLNAISGNGTTVIAVGDGGVIAYSNNSGTTWTAATVAADPGQNLSGLTVLSATTAVAVGVVNGGVSTVLRTTNSGANWSVIAVTSDLGENLNAVAFNGTNMITVGDNGAFARSSDSGATWASVQPNTTQNLNAIHFNGTTAVAVGVSNAGVSRIVQTSNSGAVWSARSVTADPGESLLDVYFVSATVVVAVGANGAILRSADGGAAWTVPATPVGNDLNAVSASGTTVIAAGAAGVVVYSTNSGSTWLAGTVAANPGQVLSDVSVLSTTVAVAVGVVNGAVSTVLRTTNSGANWSVIAVTNDLGENLNAVDFNGTTFVAVGNNGALIRSSDSGASWEPRPDFSAAQPLNSVSASGSTVIAVGDQTGGGGSVSFILRSTNSGTSWSLAPVAADPDQNLNDVTMLSATVAVAVGANGTLVRSSDGGANWSAPASPTANALTDVHYNGFAVVAVGQSGGGTSTIVQSTNSGAAWSNRTVTGDPNQNLNDVVFLTASVAVAVGDAGAIVRSTDGGATWNVVGAAVTANNLNQIVVDGTDATALLAVGAGGTILKSADSGATWAVVDGGVTGNALNAVVYEEMTGIAAGASGTIVRSSDDGANWATETSSTTNALAAVALQDSVTLAFGAGGTIRRSATGIVVTPTSLAFGNVVVGNNGVLSITVRNIGTAPLVVSNIVSSDAQFSPNVTSFTIAAGGADQTVNVTFAPSSSGAQSGNLTLSHNAGTFSTVVSMTGTGLAPVISVSPATLAYGSVAVGSPSVLALTVSNTGTSTLNVTNITSNDAQFVPAITNFTVAPAGNQVVNVTFTPAATGAQSGTLSITHDAAGSPTGVAMTGTGAVPTISVSPASLAFGNVAVNFTDNLTLTVSNAGGADLTVTGLSSSSGKYTLGPTPAVPFTITAGNDTTVQVTYTPTVHGTDVGNLSLTHNAAGSPTVVAMSGDGTLALSAQSFGFGVLELGETSMLQLTVTNNSPNPSTVSSLVSGDGQFTVDLATFALAASPGPGNSQVVNITYTPSGVGAHASTLTLTHNPVLIIVVNGVGVPIGFGSSEFVSRIAVPIGLEWLVGLFLLGHMIWSVIRQNKKGV